MPQTDNLADQTCIPCKGGMAALAPATAQKLRASLHPDWSLNDSVTSLSRRLEFKGYARAITHANLAAHIGVKTGHHPDVAFGWGYCDVTFTTHAADGLSENDFICAAKLDRMLASG